MHRNFDQARLQKMFQEIGDIKSFYYRDNHAFVEYANYVSANQAIRKYDGMRISGHTITVHSMASQRRNWWSNDDTVTYRHSKSFTKSNADSIINVNRNRQQKLADSFDLSTIIRSRSAQINKKHSMSVTTTSSAPQSLITGNPFGERTKIGKHPHESQSVVFSAKDIDAATVTTRTTDKVETYSNFVKRMTREALKDDDNQYSHPHRHQHSHSHSSSNITMSYTDRKLKLHTKNKSSLSIQNLNRGSVVHIAPIHPPPASKSEMESIRSQSQRHIHIQGLSDDGIGTGCGDKLDKGCSLLIDNTPSNMSIDDVKQEIQSLTQKKIKTFKQSFLGFYVVTFHSIQDTQDAKLNLQNAECGGIMINVQDMLICGSCKQEWDRNQMMIQCENTANCNDWFHAKCVLQNNQTTNDDIFICDKYQQIPNEDEGELEPEVEDG